MSDEKDRITALERRLEELSRPRLAKCQPMGREERMQRFAAEAFDAACKVLDATMSQREIARRLGRDERSIRDWRNGSRAVPLWAIAMLPREAAAVGLRVLADQLFLEEDTPEREVG